MNIIVWKNEIESNMYLVPYNKKFFEQKLNFMIHDEREFPDPCGRDIASIHFHLACGVDDYNTSEQHESWMEGAGIVDTSEHGGEFHVLIFNKPRNGKKGRGFSWCALTDIAGHTIWDEDMDMGLLIGRVEEAISGFADFHDERIIDVTDIVYTFGGFYT